MALTCKATPDVNLCKYVNNKREYLMESELEKKNELRTYNLFNYILNNRLLFEVG